MMKIKSSLLVGFTTLMLLFSGMGGDLKDVTKPHLGVYECVEAKMNGDDCLSGFDYVHLELKPNETFVLYYKEKEGEQKQETGKYRYDKKDKTVTMRLDGCVFFKREFPLEKGILTVCVPLGDQLLTLRFEQK